MAKVRTIVFVVLLFLLHIVSAYGKVIDIGFNIDKNDNVQLTALDTGEGERQRFFADETGQYQVLILDSRGDTLDSHFFNVDFWLQSDPPEPLNVSSHSYRLKYYSTADKVLIKHKSDVIFQRSLAAGGTCTENGVCEAGENAFNCFKDCEPSIADGYCTGLADGVCDPDCSKSEDVDCMPATPQSSSTCALPLVLFSLLSAVVIFRAV